MLTRCRIAAPARPAWNLAKTLVQTALFWMFFLYVLPMVLHRIEPNALVFEHAIFRIAAIVLFLLASTLGLWTGAVMAIRGAGTPLPVDAPREMVVTGPYSYVRNPMAISGLAQGAAVGVLLGSGGTLLYVSTGALLWNRFVRRWEEADLQMRFGEPYVRYCEHVKCWIPRWRPYCARM
jgi:protein-S-isoprenylcysteine O-methyltransferase Ste14